MKNVCYYVFLALMDTKGDRLRAARVRAGFDSAAKAAKRFGMNASTYNAHENGQNEYYEDDAKKYGFAFGVPWQFLLTGEGPDKTDDAPIITPIRSQFLPPPSFLGDRDLPVYAAVEGGPGEMVVSTDPIDVVPRPWYLGQVKDGYAVLVVGESMIPAYLPGDMAIVNPRLPPMRGKNHIFTQADEDEGSFKATIKHLVNWTADEWKLERFNPTEGEERIFTLPRTKWRTALRVVGKYDG